jgi:hypothetical protein
VSKSKTTHDKSQFP